MVGRFTASYCPANSPHPAARVHAVLRIVCNISCNILLRRNVYCLISTRPNNNGVTLYRKTQRVSGDLYYLVSNPRESVYCRPYNPNHSRLCVYGPKIWTFIDNIIERWYFWILCADVCFPGLLVYAYKTFFTLLVY